MNCICYTALWGPAKVQNHLWDGKNGPPPNFAFECPKHGLRIIYRVFGWGDAEPQRQN